MVVTVNVPNLNEELACLIRNRCQANGMNDYSVVEVHWISELDGFFRVVSGKSHLRMGFELSEPYMEWDVVRTTTLEVSK